MRRIVVLALVCGFFWLVSCPNNLRAAVIAIGNGTNESQRFDIKIDGNDSKSVQLLASETRVFACNTAADVAYRSKGKETTLKLDAYSAYVIIGRNGGIELQGVKLEGNAAPVTNLPTASHSSTTFKVSVKLLVDDADRRTRTLWEPSLKKRFGQAAEILREHTGVSFEIASIDTWESDPNASDWKGLLADFERAVKPAPAVLAVGFSSRKFALLPGDSVLKPTGFAAQVLTLQPHILIREGEPRTEPERVEVLVQQLGRYLGAIVSPDRTSVMRSRLGDGQANSTRFRIGFDVLNTLAMNLTADDLRNGKVKKLNELSSATQTRLGRIYATVLTAMPDEQLPELYLGMLERAGVPPPEMIVPAGGSPRPRATTKIERTRNAKEEAVRTVVKAIAMRAELNSKLPTTGLPARIKGDALTSAYIQEAAKTALTVEAEYRESAFLLGIGLALDDSNILRENPLTSSFCKSVESEDERRQRIAVLGNPTIRYRRDLCQHFAISAALTDMAGPELAERAGLLKEQLDMTKSSGFSFTDLCADIAGVEFAKCIKAEPTLLVKLESRFTVDNYVPKIDGLRDGITAARFQSEFGSISDAKFQSAHAELKKRVHELPAYSKGKSQ